MDFADYSNVVLSKPLNYKSLAHKLRLMSKLVKVFVITMIVIFATGCKLTDDAKGPKSDNGEIATVAPGQFKLLANNADVVGALKTAQHVDFKGREGSVTWKLKNVGETGHYDLRFLYALNDPKKQRNMDLYINDEIVTLVRFSNTGSWHYKWEKAQVIVKVNSGINTIKLVSKGNSAPNLKALIISG
ncbi:hypothetical protein KO525_13685 [Psychrosphaera sp. B3R10]|uniref:CBM6 domain-containing protein n=1 Tax=Psychrosphaera algicola TaxID=3023714 RepID=A0ABT5FB88_9GAMM|nr:MULTISPECIES: hypothetical protein [unclassified Psychrosphaera]MBU2882066.1 hypothetical protein [Psychrosphaera sp. I2R16]MBU2990434.1 hypothetical protein [Psychrosphaera sp. B3R10]MDC2888811.1 hypothetical protein [Psychrosphaera sp. G1-22]